MSVSPAKEEALQLTMKSFGILEQDIVETFVRSGGAGGQHVNKTSSCVQLLHRPTGILVKCQEDRSQAMNRFLARRILVEKIAARVLGRKSEEQQRREKIRRQKRRRSRRSKERMLQDKHHQTEKKSFRKVSGRDWGE